MTPTEHLTWCKERAIEYVDAGDLVGAVSSMVSDLGKNEKTSVLTCLSGIGTAHAMMRDTEGVRRWVNGFTMGSE